MARILSVRAPRSTSQYQYNRTGSVESIEQIAPGTFLYDVRVRHPASGSSILIEGVRESVPTYYTNNAGRYAIGDYVTVKRGGRGMWSIEGKVPDSGEYPNPASHIESGAGSERVDDTGTLIQHGNQLVEISNETIRLEGQGTEVSITPDFVRLLTENVIANLTENTEGEENASLHITRNQIGTNKRYYMLVYPEGGELPGPNDFVLETVEGSITPNPPAPIKYKALPPPGATTELGGVPPHAHGMGHEHDVFVSQTQPHDHKVWLRPIDVVEVVTTDENSVHYKHPAVAPDPDDPEPPPEPVAPVAPSVQLPRFSITFVENLGAFRRIINQSLFGSENGVSILNPQADFSYSVEGFGAKIVQPELIDAFIQNGEIITNYRLLTFIEAGPGITRTSNFGRTLSSEITKTVVKLVLDNVQFDLSEDLHIDGFSLQQAGVGSSRGAIGVPGTRKAVFNMVRPLPNIPDLGRGFKPDSSNIDSIYVISVRVQARHKDFTERSEYAYRFGYLAVPKKGYFFTS